ncbi:MAG: sugar transferase [Allosphingosinicella sp.]|uniref:sugar transferase n=1 Tax=Allosphingosinicella sp. TaxID=2823234 RepID=UPI00392199C1
MNMPVALGKYAGARRSTWDSPGWQLGMALLLAVAAPGLVRVAVDPTQLNNESLWASLAGTAGAVLLGVWWFRRFLNYPGVKALNNVVPAFVIFYGLALAIFFFARLDYSRFHFLASFVVCVVWFFAVSFRLQRRRHLRVGLVPFGLVDRLTQIGGITCIRLDQQTMHSDYDVIVADLRAEIPADWERFITDAALRGVLVLHFKQVEESLTGRVSIEHLSENNFGSLLPGLVYGRVKRAGDLAFSLLTAPLLFPLFVLLAVLIKLDSPGPAIFRQQRMGYRGRPFVMYKFRTMRHETELGPDDARRAAMTQSADSRVTKVGRFLRRYRLDELPQVLNILKGEMSWIGPRPEAVPLSLWYESELAFYRYRHIVRPGITGWAQVKQGHVAEVDEVLSKLHYDFYYIKNFSFWLDMLIVAGTLRTVISGHGVK